MGTAQLYPLMQAALSSGSLMGVVIFFINFNLVDLDILICSVLSS